MHKLYLDPFMDMCNGEILSYGIDKKPSAKNVMNALNDAIEVTADCPFRRTFPSDQGWAYQMKAYSHRLKEERIFQSMSRKGNCLDNSEMDESCSIQTSSYGCIKKTRRPKSSRKSLTLRGHLIQASLFS